jgi:hypothetical protein
VKHSNTGRIARSWKEKLMDLFERTRVAVLRSFDVMLNRVGLAPMAYYLQTLKATFSMAGNIAAFESLDLEGGRMRRVARLVRDFCIYQAMSPVLGGLMAGSKEKHIERISVLDVRMLQAGAGGEVRGDVSGSSRSRSSVRTNAPSAPLPAP